MTSVFAAVGRGGGDRSCLSFPPKQPPGLQRTRKPPKSGAHRHQI